jgi:ATP-binding cassette subfamily F protein uup
MDTLDLIEEVLMEYSGTLILVSHDRDFIDRIVTKSLVFEGESVIDEYIGGYTDYQNAKIAENKKTKSKQISKNQLSEITASKSQQTKLSFKLLYELEQLPSKIEQINEEVAYCEEMLADADLYQQDQLMFINLSQKLVLLKEQLAESELRWLHLMLLKDEASG